MGDLARRTQQIRANAKRKRIEIENKYIKVDDCKKRINDLTLTLEEIESQKLNVEERTKRLEKMIEVYFHYILAQIVTIHFCYILREKKLSLELVLINRKNQIQYDISHIIVLKKNCSFLQFVLAR